MRKKKDEYGGIQGVESPRHVDTHNGSSPQTPAAEMCDQLLSGLTTTVTPDPVSLGMKSLSESQKSSSDEHSR